MLTGVDEEAASDREGSGDQGFEGQPSGVSVGGEGGMSDGGLSDRHAKSSPSPMRPIRRHAVPSRQVRQRQLQPPFQPGAFPHGSYPFILSISSMKSTIWLPVDYCS